MLKLYILFSISITSYTSLSEKITICSQKLTKKLYFIEIMTNLSLQPPLDQYWQYIKQIFPTINTDLVAPLIEAVQNTDWDDPQSAVDLNNFAVMTLIEAEQSQDISVRSLSLELAINSLNAGVEQENYPLCATHLALVYSLIGEYQIATRIAFSILINKLQSVYNSDEKITLGLFYLPQKVKSTNFITAKNLEGSLQAGDGYTQFLLILTEVLCRTQLVFYNASGLRFLQVATQLDPNSAVINLQLGISSIVNQQWEGLLYLQRARKLAPNYAPTLQALYLAYRELQQTEIAEFWRKIALEYYQKDSQQIQWYWSQLPIDSNFTYLVFEDDLQLAVEPSFRSFVTSVLLAQGDWFEGEMEFWRNEITAGMTVIDVGANVGVYTFSAAKKVGTTGKVLAIEPFSGCVNCLEETCRVNNLSWVKIFAGAASNQNGTARLALHSANELNELITDDSEKIQSASSQEVACFTLDSIIEQEKVKRVDWLKIDAEGHEIQVLQGSDRLLREFAPGILYENIAGSKGSNTAVAEFLLSKGYQLFRYRPFLQELIPVNSLEELQGNLNIIALPSDKNK